MSHLVTFLVAGGTTVFTMPLLLVGLRRSALLDVPNTRSSHSMPVLRGGGIAVIAGIVAGAVVADLPGSTFLAVFVLAVGLGAVGLVDDLKRGTSAGVRLLVTTIVAAAASGLLASGRPAASLAAFAVAGSLGIAATVNAVNFMDGINGITGATAAIGGASLAAIGERADIPALVSGGMALAGAAVAFLPFNFPRATVFLGDVGSYAIGGVLGGLVLLGIVHGAPPEACVAPLLPYGADTSLTLRRRWSAGASLLTSHREHTYQRLAARCGSHSAATGAVALVTAACGALGVLGVGARPLVRIALSGLAVAFACAYWVLGSRLRTETSG